MPVDKEGTIAQIITPEVPFSARSCVPMPTYTVPSPPIAAELTGSAEPAEALHRSVPVLPFSA